MAENAFLTARQMAQDLVRNQVEPTTLAETLSYMREHKEEGVPGLLAYLQEKEVSGDSPKSPSSLLGTVQTHFDGFEGDADTLVDILGWGLSFMRYYRGEGNRPRPDRRPSRPRRRPARQVRESREVSVPMASLRSGQKLQGVVRRIMPYGAFVSVGAERDGLVHVSEMREGFTGDPSAVVNINDTVDVWVKSVDLEKQRISLTMKAPQPLTPPPMAAEERRPRSRQPEEPRRERPRRRNASNRTNNARFYEDEMPKEMTALGEALRAALAAQDDNQKGEETAASTKGKEQSRGLDELAEIHRRTFYG